jgi:hypothetical protein
LSIKRWKSHTTAAELKEKQLAERLNLIIVGSPLMERTSGYGEYAGYEEEKFDVSSPTAFFDGVTLEILLRPTRAEDGKN